LAGYNAGTGTVDRWVKSNIFERVIGSNSKSETVSYVRKVKNYQNVYRTMYAEELGIDTRNMVTFQGKVGDETAQVRGFVWTQIFSNIINFRF